MTMNDNDCYNCKHRLVDVHEFPCDRCLLPVYDNDPTGWEEEADDGDM